MIRRAPIMSFVFSINKRVAVALAMAVTACSAARDSAYEFALVGDNPYPPANVAKFEALIDDVNGRTSLEWVIHVGDIQGGQRCTDELFQARFDLYQRFAVPFVYTPGDNDWFDVASGEADASAPGGKASGAASVCSVGSVAQRGAGQLR